MQGNQFNFWSPTWPENSSKAQPRNIFSGGEIFSTEWLDALQWLVVSSLAVAVAVCWVIKVTSDDRWGEGGWHSHQTPPYQSHMDSAVCSVINTGKLFWEARKCLKAALWIGCRKICHLISQEGWGWVTRLFMSTDYPLPVLTIMIITKYLLQANIK